MPAISRGGVDKALSPHGTGRNCSAPRAFNSIAINRRVFIEGKPVILVGDPMEAHATPALRCSPHAPTLSKGSNRITAHGLPIGRIGDTYADGLESGHPLIAGSSRCFSN